MTDYEKLWRQLITWINKELDDVDSEINGPWSSLSDEQEWLIFVKQEPLEEFKRKMKQLHEAQLHEELGEFIDRMGAGT